MKLPMHRTLVARLTGLFALLLMLFAVVLELLFNAMMERKMIAHYSKTMQRNAYAISQNLSEMIAPSDYEALDENPFIVGEDTLAPYMALIEHITNCNVYLIDEQHRVTGYFDGVVQTMSGRVLPNYIEQTIALGFMGKTPFLTAKIDGETHLTTSMPIMNAKSHVLGVVLLESTLRELGFAQVSSSDILLFSGAVAFALTALLGALFSRCSPSRSPRFSALRAGWRAANTTRGCRTRGRTKSASWRARWIFWRSGLTMPADGTSASASSRARFSRRFRTNSKRPSRSSAVRWKRCATALFPARMTCGRISARCWPSARACSG